MCAGARSGVGGRGCGTLWDNGRHSCWWSFRKNNMHIHLCMHSYIQIYVFRSLRRIGGRVPAAERPLSHLPGSLSSVPASACINDSFICRFGTTIVLDSRQVQRWCHLQVVHFASRCRAAHCAACQRLATACGTRPAAGIAMQDEADRALDLLKATCTALLACAAGETMFFCACLSLLPPCELLCCERQPHQLCCLGTQAP